MNQLELFIYNRVKNNPELKRHIVRLYQRLCSAIPQRRLVSTSRVITRPGYFFGFHDKIPFSADNSLLLAHRNQIGNRSVRPGDLAEVGVFGGDDWQAFTPVGETRAWDWQLGAMLQWRGAAAQQIVFNDIVDSDIGSRIVSRTGVAIGSFKLPVVHVSPCGQWASSYCFRRVGKAMPGYGVRIEGDDETSLADFDCGESSDFRVFSLVDGRIRFALSLRDIQLIEPHPSMKGAFHFFHHSLFNPSGRRLFFFHRWLDVRQRRWTRMFSCDADGGRLFVLPTHEMASHVGWIDDEHLLASARTQQFGDGYYVFRDCQREFERVGNESFNSDGHPMWSPRGDRFVTDTYPDRFRNQYLYVYDMKTRHATRVLRAHLGIAFPDDLQVDLHPRFDRTGRVICFDSGYCGTRSLCTVDIAYLVGDA
jgi:hypothetical protein